MSGGVDFKRRRRTCGGVRIARIRRHARAVATRPRDRPRPRVLLDRFRRRRAASRQHRCAASLRLEPRAGFRDKRDRGLRGGLRHRGHAQPVRAVQPADQVRRPPRASASCRRDPSRNGPLRAERTPRVAGDASSRTRPSRDQAYVAAPARSATSSERRLRLGDDESKADVRAEAAASGLITAAKPESQDLCFVDVDMRSELGRGSAGVSRRGRSRMPRAQCSASTTGCRFSPSVSARVSALRRTDLMPHRAT